MKYSSYIQEFVDGTLDPSREDELFVLLSGNEELRSELKQYITMDKAFNKKLTTLVPSSAATLSLFSRLGFVADDGFLKSSTVSRNKSGFFTKYKAIISTGIISSVLTTLLFFTTFGNKIFNRSSHTDNKNQIVKNHVSVSTVNNPLKGAVQQSSPLKSSNEFSSNAGIQSNSTERIRTQNNISGTNNNNTHQGVTTESSSNINSQDLFDESKQTIPNNFSEKRNINYIPSALVLADNDTRITNLYSPAIDLRETLISERNFTNLYISEKIGMSLQISGSQYQMIATPTVKESWIPTFHNMGITVLYNLTNDLLIGFNLRNEHYFQSFEGRNELGIHYKYEQFPNYVTSTVVSKLNLLKSYPFRGFTQLALGATKTGLVGRLGLGIDVIASPDFEFFVSLEGSALRYLHQGIVFYSPKIGFNYGVSFTF